MAVRIIENKKPKYAINSMFLIYHIWATPDCQGSTWY